MDPEAMIPLFALLVLAAFVWSLGSERKVRRLSSLLKLTEALRDEEVKRCESFKIAHDELLMKHRALVLKIEQKSTGKSHKSA